MNPMRKIFHKVSRRLFTASLPHLRWLMLLCCILLAEGCANRGEVGNRSGSHSSQPSRTATPIFSTWSPEVTPYPYTLNEGNSYTPITQESSADRLQVNFQGWKPGQDATREAWFQTMNPGKQAVLIWKVRTQQWSTNVASVRWETLHSDYPNGSWDRTVIPAGGLARFSVAMDRDDKWRVTLLYSRERIDSANTNRQFFGNYEVMGLHLP